MAASCNRAEVAHPHPVYNLERMPLPIQIPLEGGGENAEEVCQICLEPLNGDLLGHTTPQRVDHIFHKVCIEKWVKFHANCSSCPYCGVGIQRPEELPESTLPSMGTVAVVAAGLGGFALGAPASMLLPVAGLAALGRYYSIF